MTTNETILEEMLDRATNSSRETVDELSLQMFCLVVKSNPKLIDRAQEMIMLKVRSNNTTESTRAINLLEECMTKCGPEFQDEASKFRFLNQLIRLVSKKYQGTDTPMPIKTRIMECLLLWTTEFPQKTKIREVYDMLCRDDSVVHGTTPAIQAKRESTLGIDVAMLSKLIKSNNPDDYKRANLLIQNRVKQDERRMEFEIQCKNNLQGVSNTVSVLDDMLKVCESESEKEDSESDTMALMHEVYRACKKHLVFMKRLPALIESYDDALRADAMETNDALQNVISRYKELVGSPKHRVKATNPDTNSNNFVENTRVHGGSNTDLLTDLLGSESNTLAAFTKPRSAASTAIDELELLGAISNLDSENTKATFKSSINDLQSIFNDGAVGPSMGEQMSTKKTDDIFGSLDILEPVNVFPAPTSVRDTQKKTNQTQKNAYRKLPDIDKLSEDLFQKSLEEVDRVYSFKKNPEKYTLNDLAQEKIKTKNTPISPSKTFPKVNEIELDQKSDNKTGEYIAKDDDDLILPTKDEESIIKTLRLDDEKSGDKTIAKVSNLPQVKHLTDVDIDLDEIEPADVEPITLKGDDITLMLNFTKNRIAGCKHVAVIVISANNKSKSLVNNFKLDASVRKPCKVRVLEPTATTMPPCKPFRPATPINQVLLLLNPTSKPIDVTCIMEYQLDDDPDPIKEALIAESIPYVD